MHILYHCTAVSKPNWTTVTSISIYHAADRCEWVMSLSQVHGEMRERKQYGALLMKLIDSVKKIHLFSDIMVFQLF